ncbi:hypothetical protein RF11_07358 [Thelohanellus kitauei]|uniref:Prolactin regulatory element-binding protein n=1 Tax=Thelohanellus kitauei TaxID=669202 RepID=A0A0C2I602_THEKT|nr:hypothetical protein RF11_07358 [Thelohanellus kitauei]
MIYAEFPITCSVLIDDFLVVGGGGGPVKSGIKNGIIIYEILPNFRLSSKILDQYYDSDVPMYLIRHDRYLVVCCDYGLYIYEYQIAIKISLVKSIRTGSNAYVTTACVDKGLIFLGDDGGNLYKFEFKKVELSRFETSKSQITSISVHPSHNQVLSYFKKIVVTTRTESYVRNSADLSEIYSLDVDFCDVKHFIRNSAFGSDGKNHFLFTVHLQAGRGRPAYIVKWSTSSYFPILCVKSPEHFISIKSSDLCNVLMLGSSAGRLSVFKYSNLHKMTTTPVIHSVGISSINIMGCHKNMKTITTSPDGSISITSIESMKAFNHISQTVGVSAIVALVLSLTKFIFLLYK